MKASNFPVWFGYSVSCDGCESKVILDLDDKLNFKSKYRENGYRTYVYEYSCNWCNKVVRLNVKLAGEQNEATENAGTGSV